MATPARRCLICGKSLAGKSPKALTCGPAHQKALSRRREREREKDRASAGRGADSIDELTSLVNAKTQDAVRAAFVEELRPVIREAIDQDAVRAIQGMVGLAPAAILVLQQDLASTDPILRSKAAALVVKYTMGNALVTPPRADQGEKLVIINQLPRPEAVAQDELLPGEANIEAEATELRRCDTCRLDKPVDQFPADGPRCAQCLFERKERVITAILKPEEREALLSENAVRQPSPTADVQRPREPGRPEVRQVGAGLQPGDLRPSGLVENRQADPSGHEGGSAPPWAARVQSTASETFGGPPDPKRFSNGR